MPRGEGIKPIAKLFERYKQTLKAPQASVIGVFCEVVNDILSIEIDEDTVQYNPTNKVLSLNMSGVIKSEIKLHQKEILEHLKGRLGVSSAPTNIL